MDINISKFNCDDSHFNGTLNTDFLSTDKLNVEFGINVPCIVSKSIEIRNNRIDGLLDPIEKNDAATKSYVDNLNKSFKEIKLISNNSEKIKESCFIRRYSEVSINDKVENFTGKLIILNESPVPIKINNIELESNYILVSYVENGKIYIQSLRDYLHRNIKEEKTTQLKGYSYTYSYKEFIFSHIKRVNGRIDFIDYFNVPELLFLTIHNDSDSILTIEPNEKWNTTEVYKIEKGKVGYLFVYSGTIYYCGTQV